MGDCLIKNLYIFNFEKLGHKALRFNTLFSVYRRVETE